MERLEKNDADNVLIQVNNQPATVRKNAKCQREKGFFAAIIQFHGAEVKNVALKDSLCMVEWFMDYDHAAYGRAKSHPLAVQNRHNGQITNEHFYYGS